ncbi:MAG: Asp-tRNA(Asn)/Glu-tRNA(Gln) amidotransferase subunit GatA [Candidatus Moranbacteria bacterium]|nr:Asp-tRNA(Asn)/Glu-tRNA(Gln) amidotransferase subunit GatA [Candidatus Moranbacteria bacterium]
MIKELHQKLSNKELKAKDLAEKHLDKIEKRKEVNAFLEVYRREALEEAQKADKKISEGKEIGLLEGLPCALKDNLCVKGRRATAGSKILENYISPYDAFVVGKTRQAGAVLLGKTNLDEFAMGSSTENSAYGPTKNPLDETRVPGGSSGGSAAAVADGQAVWALGSDTGGSIRQPASFCSVVGLKPTYGRVSRSGLIAMASSYDQIGPITQSVEDAAIVLDAICGKDDKDNTTVSKETGFYKNLSSQLGGKKIGIPKEFMEEDFDAEIKEMIERQAEQAKKQGAEIVEISLPNVKYSLAVYYLMMPSEVSSNLARFDGVKYGYSEALKKNSKSKDIMDVYFNSRKEGFGEEVKRRIILGTYALSAGYKDAYYKKAQMVRELIKQDFRKAFEEVDLILGPTTPTPPFKIGEKTADPLEMYLADIFTVPVNIAMLPAVSMNGGWIEKEGKKLPLGMQLIGKWWGEQELLNAALAFEKNESANK